MEHGLYQVCLNQLNARPFFLDWYLHALLLPLLFTLFRLFLSQLYFILYYRCLCWFNFLNRYGIEENMSIMKQLELFFSQGLPIPFLSLLIFFFPFPKFLQNSYSICRSTCYWRDPNNSLFKIIKSFLKMQV